MLKIRQIKKARKGGQRTKRRLYSSQARFLEVLSDTFGGSSELEKLTGIPAQRFINWKVAGKISLKKAGIIARALEVPVWLLNYKDIFNLMSDNGAPVPDWATLIWELEGIPAERKEYILNGKLPS